MELAICPVSKPDHTFPELFTHILCRDKERDKRNEEKREKGDSFLKKGQGRHLAISISSSVLGRQEEINRKQLDQ